MSEDAKAARKRRLAEALRANLRRRKAAAEQTIEINAAPEGGSSDRAGATGREEG